MAGATPNMSGVERPSERGCEELEQVSIGKPRGERPAGGKTSRLARLGQRLIDRTAKRLLYLGLMRRRAPQLSKQPLCIHFLFSESGVACEDLLTEALVLVF